MTDPKYKAFTALDPFFDIVQRGLAGHVDGDHYFDTIADNAVFEFRYIFPGWPQKLNSREALMALYAGYGDNIVLHGADALIVHRSQDARVVILEYEVHGKICQNRRILRQPVHIGRDDRGPQDCEMAGLYGFTDCHDCA